MKRTVLFAALSALSLSLAAPSRGAGDPVGNLAAAQRYPWNGLVDVSFTLAAGESEYHLAFAATNSATGAAIPVGTLRDAGGNAVTAQTAFAPGAVSLVWDAGADAPGIVADEVALSVVTAAAPMRGKVQLWAGGPFWATTNIGAEAPEEYGLYFWWGDTVGYRREGGAWVASDGSSQNFEFSEGNTPTYGKSTSTLRSEGWTTSAGVLAPEHDAAHVHWGGSWRMPTYQELYDLCYNKCDWTWTTRNGVDGYVVRGRCDYSSASIFFPAAGLGDWTSLLNAGSDGYYWLSVPVESHSILAGQLYFYSGYHVTGIDDRHFGFVVRPVQGFAE